MGSGRLNVYNLGEAGVNLTKSPLHQSDGELIQAQNAIRSLNNVDGGLVKRESLSKLNAVALDGTVRGIASLPLPNPLAAIDFYAFLNGTPPASSTRKSTGGTTWANDNALEPHASRNAGATFANKAMGRAAINPRKRRFYYFGAHDGGFSVGQAPPIYVFDGTSNALLCRLPGNPYADVSGVVQGMDMLTVGQLIYVSTYDGTRGAGLEQYGSVYRLDENGQLTRLGAADDIKDGGVTCMAWWLGKLWCGSSSRIVSPFASIVTPGNVYSIRPFFDANWTAEPAVVAATDPLIMSMAVFKGELYISTCAESGAASRIRKRTPAGTWSTVYTNPDTGDQGHIAHLTVHDGAIYGVRVESVAYVQYEILRSTDGATWSVDRNVAAVDGVSNQAGVFLSVDGDLYHVVCGGAILRRRSGTWTNVDANNVDMRGPLAYVRARN